MTSDTGTAHFVRRELSAEVWCERHPDSHRVPIRWYYAVEYEFGTIRGGTSWPCDVWEALCWMAQAAHKKRGAIA